MTTTTSVSVSSTILTEILSQLALAPLRSRFALLAFLNAASIDGKGTGTRRIPKRKDIADAVADTENVAFTAYEEMTFDTPVDITPATYVQGVQLTVDAMRKAMPGMTRDGVVAALRAMSPLLIPLVAEAAVDLLQAHYRVAERAGLALFSGLSGSAGTTNTALSIAALIDGQTALIDNKPEHRTIACFVDAKGIKDVRQELASTSAPTILASGWGDTFLNSLGTAAPASLTPFGNLLGMPILEIDADLQATANAGVDRVGGIVCVGRGETGRAGSLRGFAEICESFGLAMDIFYDLESDTGKVVGRYGWAVAEHSDEHGVKLIYKKT